MTRKTRRKMRKMLVLLSCAVLLVCITIGATVAYLTDKTGSIVNTFTVGDVDITLTETPNTDTDKDQQADAWFGKMVPGVELSKDPKVTVLADSEACWVFVKVEKGNNPDAYLDYSIAGDWAELTEGSGIYYREATDTDADQVFAILTGDKVKVKTGVTKEQLDAVTANPTLTFTAYACQKAGFDTAAAAWAEVNK